MNKKMSWVRIAVVASLAASLLAISAAAQSVVTTVNFSPPGLTNVGILSEITVVENTGLVYAAAGTTPRVAVIDPNTDAVAAVVPLPTVGGIAFALVNQSTELVYMLQGNSSIIVIDGRPASGSFNQALPSLSFPSYAIRSFAFDETRELLYVTSVTTGLPPVQGHVLIIDANPASANFHQTLYDIAMPANSPPLGVAVNAVTNNIYLGAQANGPGGMSGVFVLNGATQSLTRITGTVPSFDVVVNEPSNLVYATSNNNRLTAIDGATNSLLALIPMPGLIDTQLISLNERLAVNRLTGRAYVQSRDFPSPAKVIVVDGDRLSPTFNTVLTTVTVGREGNSLLVDESLNRILTSSIFDFGTYGTTIIDGATNAIIASIPAADWCFDSALDRVSHRAYVATRLFIVQKIDVTSASLTAATLTGGEAGSGVVNPNNHLLYTSRVVQYTDILTVDQNGTPGPINALPHGNGDYFLGTINKTTNRIYFSNGDADLTGLTLAAPGYVSVIDGSSNSVITNVQVGNRPFGIKANEVTNKIYVANFGSGQNLPGGITVIDGVTNTVVSADVSAFPINNRTFLELAVNETTNKVYFWVSTGSSGVLDGTSNVATQLPATLGPVASIRVNKVLNRVYVSSKTGVLHVLDAATDAEIATLNIGTQGSDDGLGSNIAVNETTGRVFVTNFNNGTVTVVSGATNSIVATIPIGSGATSPAVNELTNRVYVSNLNDKTVSFIDGASSTVTATLAVPMGLRYLSVDPAVSRVYGIGELADEKGGVVVIADALMTALGPAQIWLGLKNSDDVGTKFDLLAEVLKNGSLVGSGQLNNVPGGSSGFNNAVLRTINLALSLPVNVSAGDTLSIKLSVRIAVGVAGHRSGTARLWFNDSAANSRFGATIGGATADYFLRDGFALGNAAGPGPKKTIDVFVDRAVGGNPFKPFGTWSKTF